jgi:hypothetical protein
VRRLAAGVIAAMCFAAAAPIASMLRAAQPLAPAANEIGAGRLLGGVLTGALRPTLLTYLWIRAGRLERAGRHDELFRLYRTMLQLYPDNASAHRFLGWHMAFNLKSEEAREIGWKWARAGLDVIDATPEGPPTIADWILKQCGQNAIERERYAGPAWERERWWRARLRTWGEERYGVSASRFELAVHVLAGRRNFLDRARRARALELLAYDDLVRTGTAPRGAEAVAALRAMADDTTDAPAIRATYLRYAEVLASLVEGRVPTIRSDDARIAYPAAAALLGAGARARSGKQLGAAATLFAALDVDGALVPERAMTDAWLHWVASADGPPPPLPFD